MIRSLPAPPEFVVVGPTPPPIHGVAAMTVEVVAALQKLQRGVDHVDTRDPRPLSTIGRLDFRNVFLGFKHARQLSLALSRRPDAAVYLPVSQSTWGFVRDAVLVAVAKAHRRQLVVHLHGGHLQDFYRRSPRVMRWVIRLVLGQVDEAWALTSALRKEFEGLVSSDQILSVANVVPDPRRGFTRASSPRRVCSGFRLLYLANLLPEKGCFELLEALRRVPDLSSSDWEVRLVGAGAPAVERRLRQEAASISAAGPSIKLLGELHGEQKADQYRWADAFVYPTYYPFEGQPLVLLEALAAGLPIVSTIHAGIPETIRDGVEAVLVEPQDPRQLAAAICRLAVDEQTRNRLAQAARRRYEAAYRPERLVLDFTEALERAASRSIRLAHRESCGTEK